MGPEPATAAVSLTAIVPVTERVVDPERLYLAYKSALEATGLRYEIIYILDGEYPKVRAVLDELNRRGERVKIIALAKPFGEATSLTIGIANASGELILTLPSYPQVVAEEIPSLVRALNGYDMAVARRWPRLNTPVKQIQSGVFHRLVHFMMPNPFHDLGCGVRVFKRNIMDELNIYGDQHRFLPLIAYNHGYKVLELPLRQDPRDAVGSLHRPGIYVRRVLDILAMVFLLKFTHKPLRFFGLLGTGLGSAGALLCGYLTVAKLFFSEPLSDRPALILGALLLVLGIQLVAIGLIGEIIIFTRGRRIKEYRVEEIVGGPAGPRRG